MVSPTLSLPLPEIGQTVPVSWGLGKVEGKVVDVYGHGPLTRITVEIPILGSDGEQLDSEFVSLPLEALRPD